jgi:hypothetical protein
MVNLARQVFPLEEDKLSVLRAKNGLVPDLRLHIGECETIHQLMEKAGSVISTLRARDHLYGTHTRLPPLHGFRSKDFFERGSVPQKGNSQNPRQSSNNGNRNYSNDRNDKTQGNQYSGYRNRINSDPPRLPRGEYPRVECYNCKERGHFIRDCPKLENGNNRRGNNTPGQETERNGNAANGGNRNNGNAGNGGTRNNGNLN